MLLGENRQTIVSVRQHVMDRQVVASIQQRAVIGRHVRPGEVDVLLRVRVPDLHHDDDLEVEVGSCGLVKDWDCV